MSGERALQKGWIVKESKSYPGKVYYFNIDTGASIWEHPDLHNSSSSNNYGLELAENESKCNDFPIPDFMGKDDPRIGRLVKRVYDRLTKTTSNVENQADFNSRNKKSTIPTAIVTPVLSDKELMLNKISNITSPFRKYKKFASSKKDPRLFRRRALAPSTVNCACGNAGAVPGVNSIGTYENKNFVNNHVQLSSDEDSVTSSPGLNENQDFSNQDSSVSTESLLSDSSMSDQESSNTENGLNRSGESSDEDLALTMFSNSVCETRHYPVKKSSKPTDYYYVVDTNVLLGALRHVIKIFNSSVDKNDVPHLFIPWIVIQEIDSLLRRHSKEQKVYKMARLCSKFINNMVKEKNPRFHCQTVQEVQDWAKEYSECNDDRLLECCLSLGEKMPLAKVILVTNDVNLDTKAHILGIPVFSIKDLVSKFNFTHNSRKKNLSTKLFKSVKSNFTPKSSKSVKERVSLSRTWSSLRNLPGKLTKKKEKSQIISEAFLELKNVLQPFLFAELKKVYGDNWKGLNLNLSNMKCILNVIVQHWEKCFNPNFSNKIKKNFMFLQKNFKGSDYFRFKTDDYLNTLTAIEDIFCDIKRKCPSLEVNIENIQDMRVACIKQLSNCNTDVTLQKPKIDDALQTMDIDASFESNEASSNVKLKSASEIVPNLFEHNWTVIHQLCGTILDFYGVTHGLIYEKPDEIPSSLEFQHMIHKLCPAVEEIKTLLQKIVKTESSLSNSDFEKFASVMVNFVPSLNIETESIDLTHFNAGTLAEFCRSADNLEILLGGYKQLEIYLSHLERASTLVRH